jgi:cell division transport system permease protein
MTAWLAQHLQTFTRTLQRLAQAPFGNLLAIGVMAVAVSLPTGLYLLVANLHAAAGNLAQTPQISVFMKPDASTAE